MQEDGLINSAKKWSKLYGGDITQYLPIGYLSYSEINVLYEINSGKIFLENLDNEGLPENNPIANSFEELISNLKIFTAILPRRFLLPYALYSFKSASNRR